MTKEDAHPLTGPINADQPITQPEDDLLGLAPFASALASAVHLLESPYGTAIGLHGPWGIGKSSALNLMKQELKTLAPNIKIIDFNPWWFTGEDSLSRAFFSEIATALKDDIGEEKSEALRSIGRRVRPYTAPVAAATGALAGSLGEKSVKALADLLDGAIEDRTIAEEHRRISGALLKSENRYLIVIDDLDRLDPNEAAMVFKLVKAVGRLPNVIYLMVFDRALIERVFDDRFKGADGQYLDKIVQASFEVPAPIAADLRDMLQAGLRASDIWDDEDVHFLDCIIDCVWPALDTPRDVNRILNSIRVLYPVVRADVDDGDFLGIEAIRFRWPSVHKKLWNNRSLVLGEVPLSYESEEDDQSALIDKVLLDGVQESQHTPLRSAIVRLFPKMAKYWSNGWGSPEHSHEWNRRRRICTDSHFDA